jgi:hypothetical protein
MRLEVSRSWDLERVLALPRRTLNEDEARERAAWLTKRLAFTPTAALRTWQGMALWETALYGGLFLGLAVGGGKSLTAYLTPTVLDAVRPILCIPAGLRDDTLAMWRTYQGVWRAPNPGITIVTFEELTNETRHDLLERMRPDVIIIDECDMLSNIHRSSAAKRIARYVGDHEPHVVAMTGTVGRNSINDYRHILVWTLKDGAPVPIDSPEGDMWAAALDEKLLRGATRPRLGALSCFGTSLETAREGYRDRLNSTPGVIIVDGDSCDQPLTIRQLLAPEDATLDRAFTDFRQTLQTADGWYLNDSLSTYRYASELGTGMYYRYNPRPPEWWLTPRREYNAFVRTVIDRTTNASRRNPITFVGGEKVIAPLDTEAQVLKVFRKHPLIVAWEAVEGKFTPQTEGVWVSSSVVQYCAEWLRRGPGLVWCGTTEFGRALATAARVKYYGAKGEDDQGRPIRNADPRHGAVLSLAANRRGRNLQAWSRNLFVQPPQSGRYIEQTIGRTHRAGQDTPVTVEFLITSGDIHDAFDAALREAQFQANTVGIRQKLLKATVERVTPVITSSNEFRWARRNRAPST